MKNIFVAAASLLVGAALFVSASAAGEMMMCGGTSATTTAEPNIAIVSENGGTCGGTEMACGGAAIAAADAQQTERRSYKITNTGNVKLTNIRVIDERFANINCQTTDLEVGQSMTCVAHDLISGTELQKRGACATGDHITVKESGVQVTTKGDCDSGA
ncbi:hypothetical protein GCAAIG_14050 [Candidatus Electronema halotolerans]